jgi:hypothetical protein
LAIDEQHVALPKLYGAPAYARPPRMAADTPRPFDPDDLPIEAVRTRGARDVFSLARPIPRVGMAAARPSFGPVPSACGPWPAVSAVPLRTRVTPTTDGGPLPNLTSLPHALGSRGRIAAGE